MGRAWGLDRKLEQGDDDMDVKVGQGNEMEDASVWGGFLVSEWLSEVYMSSLYFCWLIQFLRPVF